MIMMIAASIESFVLGHQSLFPVIPPLGSSVNEPYFYLSIKLVTRHQCNRKEESKEMRSQKL